MLDNLQLLFVFAPVMNVQMILDGIFIGAVFALAAYGLALVWGVMNVKNLAQGDFVIMGGYLAFSLFNMGVGPIAALPIVAAVMFGFGWICYLLIPLFIGFLLSYSRAPVPASVIIAQNNIRKSDLIQLHISQPVRPN